MMQRLDDHLAVWNDRDGHDCDSMCRYLDLRAAVMSDTDGYRTQDPDSA